MYRLTVALTRAPISLKPMWYAWVVKVIGKHQVFIFSEEICLHACVCVKLKCSGIKQISKGQTMRRLFIYYKLWMSSQGSLIAWPCVRTMMKKGLNEHVGTTGLVLVSLHMFLNYPCWGQEGDFLQAYVFHCCTVLQAWLSYLNIKLVKAESTQYQWY